MNNTIAKTIIAGKASNINPNKTAPIINPNVKAKSVTNIANTNHLQHPLSLLGFSQHVILICGSIYIHLLYENGYILLYDNA